MPRRRSQISPASIVKSKKRNVVAVGSGGVRRTDPVDPVRYLRCAYQEKVRAMGRQSHRRGRTFGCRAPLRVARWRSAFSRLRDPRLRYGQEAPGCRRLRPECNRITVDNLSERRRIRNEGLYLLGVFSLRRIRYLGGTRIFGERAVGLSEHNTVTRRVATVVDEICMGIERRREARCVCSPCVAESVHIEVGNACPNFGRKLRPGSIRKKFKMRFDRKCRSILKQSLQFDQSTLLQSVE